jgi:hypothetical protein
LEKIKDSGALLQDILQFVTIHIDFLTSLWFIAEQTETIGKNVAMYIGFTVFESYILSVQEESLV